MSGKNENEPKSVKSRTTKSIIVYPTVSKFLSFINENDFDMDSKLTDSLKEFFDSRESRIRLTLDPENINILYINTQSKLISGSHDKIIKELEKNNIDLSRKIHTYILENNSDIPVLGLLPLLPQLIRFNNSTKFDLVVCQNLMLRTNIIPHLCDLCIKSAMLILDKPLPRGYDIDRIDGWTYLERSRMFDGLEGFESFIKSDGIYYAQEFKDNIRNSDITLEKFISYNSSKNLEKTELDLYLHDFISWLLERETIELNLSSKNYNVLIICTNDYDIKSGKVMEYINDCLSDNIEIEDDSKLHHIGSDISVNKNPHINRCLIPNLRVNSNNKFDLIISNHCIYTTLNLNINHLKSLLNPGGSIIVSNSSTSSNLTSENVIGDLKVYKINNGRHLMLVK